MTPPPTLHNWQLNNREAGPSNAWCTELRGPTQGPLQVPGAYLQTRTPARGAVYMPELEEGTEKDWPKRPYDRQLQEAGRKTLMGP